MTNERTIILKDGHYINVDADEGEKIGEFIARHQRCVTDGYFCYEGTAYPADGAAFLDRGYILSVLDSHSQYSGAIERAYYEGMRDGVEMTLSDGFRKNVHVGIDASGRHYITTDKKRGSH